ncbi:Asp-tRNA(Asn)/Glu-tRNA(Gln) amidotransferase subunit GatC [Lactococcus garvieae]|jgi:aspartyl-tRNA(Asn)/glutamyl-tRNA(Gln) amidotransferase subunit C|uniref:Aspartyl/glutamyl-tRNA(Asn/Gln) amidotransferase subunit C n=1 Tax=Lactococcus garvieae DCC43 TaxID=1231377 RepID=K2NW08_9LACT|nr:Asp-tRNA(Asn)/Glu-tRNA(Gln) amidotransferase subunit GatC [Lactococcus garvieae]EKF51748.1 Aspartyl-tRNA(Asn) amidotransferase subunit C /Glutamyl-tRNA(Gln) amidotransferase subunit C [Lactococcus garvieae DCC43]QPS70899.1 Asp-tRNA(Asn)/Glu-tRNA(Gln) amidotransferase subunit GatC [Lactococcus garvieae]
MSKITKEQVEHVATLSKLKFAENELDTVTDQLDKIIEMVEQLEEVNTDGVEFTMSVADNLNRMREDIAVAGDNREDLMRNVPTKQDGFIKVPAMLADGGDA